MEYNVQEPTSTRRFPCIIIFLLCFLPSFESLELFLQKVLQTHYPYMNQGIFVRIKLRLMHVICVTEKGTILARPRKTRCLFKRPLVSGDVMDRYLEKKGFDPVSIGFALNPEYPVFGSVMSTFGFLSLLGCILFWAWFLSTSHQPRYCCLSLLLTCAKSCTC